MDLWRERPTKGVLDNHVNGIEVTIYAYGSYQTADREAEESFETHLIETKYYLYKLYSVWFTHLVTNATPAVIHGCGGTLDIIGLFLLVTQCRSFCWTNSISRLQNNRWV